MRYYACMDAGTNHVGAALRAEIRELRKDIKCIRAEQCSLQLLLLRLAVMVLVVAIIATDPI